MKIAPLLIATLALGTLASQSARADDDQWVVRFGAHLVDPDNHTGHLAGLNAHVGKDVKPSGSLEYLITPSWGVDVLAALPFKHTVRLNSGKAASTKQLPPTLGINYHFMPDAQISPFVGAGINYTHFFDAKGDGALQGAKVRLGDSWGAAAHAGVDFKLNASWIVTADVRWMHIRSNVHVDGAQVGHARIDPFVYGLSIGRRF